MRTGLFILLLTVGVACGAGGYISLRDSMSIEFAKKSYQDDKENVVSMSGTLKGQLDYPDNTCGIACYRDLKQCWIACAQAIGAAQLGPITPPFSYDIRSWTDNEIVADSSISSGELFACNQTTIKIARPTGQVLWIEKPVNQAEPICKDVESRIRTSSMEDGPASKSIFRRKN